MFSITVFLGDTIAPIVLLFKGEDTLRKAVEALDGEIAPMDIAGLQKSIALRVTLEDDFGQIAHLCRAPLAVLVQDLKQAQEADILRGVHQATTQAKANDRAQSDPFLQAHFRKMQRGPAVLDPLAGQPRFS